MVAGADAAEYIAGRINSRGLSKAHTVTIRREAESSIVCAPSATADQERLAYALSNAMMQAVLSIALVTWCCPSPYRHQQPCDLHPSSVPSCLSGATWEASSTVAVCAIGAGVNPEWSRAQNQKPTSARCCLRGRGRVCRYSPGFLHLREARRWAHMMRVPAIRFSLFYVSRPSGS